MVVAVGIMRDTCEARIQVTLIRPSTGAPASVRVVVAYPESTPPLTKSESLLDPRCPMIRERAPSREELPQASLDALVDELTTLRISPVPEPVLWLHGIHYDFLLTSPFASTELQFWAPAEPQSGFETHPLDAWARRLTKLLDLDCAAGVGGAGAETP